MAEAKRIARTRGEETTRRDFIFIAAGAVAAVGAAATIWPFIDQMNPAADTRAMSTTEVDLTAIAVGQQIKVMWQGKPVFVRHRTAEEIASALRDDFANSKIRKPTRNASSKRMARPAKPEWLILQGQLHPPGLHSDCLRLIRAIAATMAAGSARATARIYDTSGRIRSGPGAEESVRRAVRLPERHFHPHRLSLGST